MNRSIAIAAIILAIFITGCGASTPPPNTPTPTGVPCTSDEYYDLAECKIEEWDDATKVANNTGRGNLSGPIADLQRIAREFEDIEVRGCYAVAHNYFHESRVNKIDGFLSFMADYPDDEVDQYFEDSDDQFNLALGELIRLDRLVIMTPAPDEGE